MTTLIKNRRFFLLQIAIIYNLIMCSFCYSGSVNYQPYLSEMDVEQGFRFCHSFYPSEKDSEVFYLDEINTEFVGDKHIAFDWQARCICDEKFRDEKLRSTPCKAYNFDTGKSFEGCTCGYSSDSEINTFTFDNFPSSAVYLSNLPKDNPNDQFDMYYDKTVVVIYAFTVDPNSIADINNLPIASAKSTFKFKSPNRSKLSKKMEKSSAVFHFCGDGETQSNEGEKCDDGKNNGKVGFCNSVCSGYISKQTIVESAEKPYGKIRETRIALLVGNADYKHGGQLANPVNDVKALESVLKNDCGFHTILHENLDQKEMKKSIDDFGSRLSGYQVRLFFYAGHGVQVNGRNYLIPVDAELKSEKQVEYDCIDASRVLSQMEKKESGTNIIILDACRDNPFERSWSRSARGKGLAFMDAPDGYLIAYATSPGKTASDGDGENGLYTSALLKHISTSNISIMEMFMNVRNSVKKQSGGLQVPWEATSLTGNFYFKKD